MGNRWAILIGINLYHESLGSLRFSVNDCRRLEDVLTTGGCAFPAENVLVLSDDEDVDRKPTYANIHSWLVSWLAQPDEDDTVLVFFAGHGREMDGNCFLVPSDATLQTIHVTGIAVRQIQELLNRCKARQKILVLDACHTGAGRDVLPMGGRMMAELSKGKGVYTLTSCGVDELSHEWPEKSQGVFTHYFANALLGACPDGVNGQLTIDGVYDWVYDRVRQWAGNNRCIQNPTRVSEGAGAIVLVEPTTGRAGIHQLRRKGETPTRRTGRNREGDAKRVKWPQRTAGYYGGRLQKAILSTAEWVRRHPRKATIWTGAVVAAFALAIATRAWLDEREFRDRRAEELLVSGRPLEALGLVQSDRLVSALTSSEPGEGRWAPRFGETVGGWAAGGIADRARLQWELQRAVRLATRGDFMSALRIEAAYRGVPGYSALRANIPEDDMEALAAAADAFISEGLLLKAGVGHFLQPGNSALKRVHEQARVQAEQRATEITAESGIAKGGDLDWLDLAWRVFHESESLEDAYREAKILWRENGHIFMWNRATRSKKLIMKNARWTRWSLSPDYSNVVFSTYSANFSDDDPLWLVSRDGANCVKIGSGMKVGWVSDDEIFMESTSGRTTVRLGDIW